MVHSASTPPADWLKGRSKTSEGASGLNSGSHGPASKEGLAGAAQGSIEKILGAVSHLQVRSGSIDRTRTIIEMRSCPNSIPQGFLVPASASSMSSTRSEWGAGPNNSWSPTWELSPIPDSNINWFACIAIPIRPGKPIFPPAWKSVTSMTPFQAPNYQASFASVVCLPSCSQVWCTAPSPAQQWLPALSAAVRGFP